MYADKWYPSLICSCMRLLIQTLNSECPQKLAHNTKLTSGYCLWAMLMLHWSSFGNCIVINIKKQFFCRNFMHQKIDQILLYSGHTGTLSVYEWCKHLFKSKKVSILTYSAIESYCYITFLIKCIYLNMIHSPLEVKQKGSLWKWINLSNCMRLNQIVVRVRLIVSKHWREVVAFLSYQIIL